jgi:hypothetical protein
MKRSLIAVAGLAVLSTPAAFASKARLSALGQNVNGSYYIKDQRSTFLNPAAFNTYNNFVITEWGDDANDGSAEAEGGFARQASNFVYSVYLGNDDARNADKATSAPTYLENKNTVDLSFAGDAGIQWGGTLQFSMEDDNSQSYEQDGSKIAIRGGVMADMFEGYLHFTIKDDVDGSGTAVGDKLEKSGFAFGGSYMMNDWTFFAHFSDNGNESTDADATVVTASRDKTHITLGAGNTRKISDDATMWWDVTYKMESTETPSHAAASTSDVDTNSLNITVAFESKATSWLTLRGSVSQPVFIDSRDTEATGAAKTEVSGATGTTVAAGASLTFGKLTLDGTLAASSNNGGLIVGGSDSENGKNSTLSQVALHYFF